MRDTLTPSLTREQQTAVDVEIHALEIRAGAGTGKTLTLAHRVARLAPDVRRQMRTQVVTFTRDATTTLDRRLSLILGRDHAVRVHSFHQWAARELPPEARRFFPAPEGRRAIAKALRRAGPSLTRALGATTAGDDDSVARVSALLSYVKNHETTLGQALTGPFAHLAPWEDDLELAQNTYEHVKGDRLDYDDLLVTFRDKLRDSRFRLGVISRLDHLFVDEYQDVNSVQADIVHRLTKPGEGARVTVVGDTRQSIYGFRGGSPKHMEEFLEPYRRNGRRVALRTCFRASRRLVAAGNVTLPDEHPLRARPGAPTGTPPDLVGTEAAEDEADAVLDRIEAWLVKAVDPREIVVLARSRHLMEPIVDAARQRAADDAWAARDPDALVRAIESFAVWRRGRGTATMTDFAVDKDVKGADMRAARILARRMRAHGVRRASTARLATLPPTEGLAHVGFQTIHAAKGLEWDHVILVGARDGGLPSEPALRAAEAYRDEAIAEERRLLYVALTRARSTFTASWTTSGRRGGPSQLLTPLLPKVAPPVALAVPAKARG